MGFRFTLISALCIAFAALTGVGALSYERTVQDDEDSQWVAHTHQVLETLASIHIDLIDAETGDRGFILTGEDGYLQPYQSGLDRLKRDIASARSLTPDNPTQQQALNRLEPMVATRLEELRSDISARQQGGLDAAKETVRQTAGRQTMLQIRAAIGDMEQEERRLLAYRLAIAHQGSSRTRVLVVTGDGVGLLFLLMSGIVIYLEMGKRHKAEAELRQSNARTEAVNKELQAFSYSVSHDLRAPLRGIDGFSLALLEDYASQLDDDAKDYLQRIRKATVRMGKLIDNLLELARTTRTEMLTEDVDLSGLAEDVAAQCRAAEPLRKGEFVIAPGLRVQGDRVLMRAMMENLIGNAWKYTSKKDEARIELGVSANGEGRNGNGTVYFVKDNGAGFDMRYANKLFGIFQRLHDATEFPGTGVGLATVQRIVNRHDGRVWAESKPDEGATFYFQIGGAW